MAGYTGSEVIDSSGVRWTPDRYYATGGSWTRPGGFIRGTSRPFLFKTWRTGEFGYNIPLKPGSYELRLFFVAGQAPGDEKISAFGVALPAFGATMTVVETWRAFIRLKEEGRARSVGVSNFTVPHLRRLIDDRRCVNSR